MYKVSKIKSIKKIFLEQDCYDITIDNFGRYFANNILVHNTDGQQLSISWKNGKLIAARNKKHLANHGENAMDIKGVADLFAGRGDIEIAYNAAMKDLNASIGALSEADKKKYFDEGRKFASLEIITPATQNTVPYGLNMLVFHGIIEYDKLGNPIGEDKQAARDLGKLIKDANLEAQETFFVRGPNDIDVKPLPNTQERKSYYIKKYQEILKKTGLGPDSTVKDYVLRMSRIVLEEEAKKAGISIPDSVIEGLSMRIANISKSFSLSMIKKELGDSFDWYINLEKNHYKELKDRIYAPLESLFLEIGTEFMKNISSFLSANPTKASEAMRKEIDSTINKIRTNGDAADIEKLKRELKRITAAGGLDAIVPTEGITFVYKGKLYKYTGIFAPIHQLRSILAYKKNK